MATDAETLVRAAYHAAEGNVLDIQGFKELFTEDGCFNFAGGESYCGEHLGDPVLAIAGIMPDVHRELHLVHVIGNVVAIELSIRGTFTGKFQSPAGVIEGTGVKFDIPCADFWYIQNGKIKDFNCHPDNDAMFRQRGVKPDFATAVAASAVAAS